MKNETKVIAVVNQKGGVGKTTTTYHVGVGLAEEGKRVLLLDFDPQGDLTTYCGYTNNEEIDNTIAKLMMQQANGIDFDPYECILHNEEQGIDLIPSNLDLASAETLLMNAFTRESILKNCIEKFKRDYDYIVIDCQPALGILTINALSAATDVLIPVQTQYLSAKGMTKLMETIGKVRNSINPKLNIAGICFTMAQENTNMTKLTIESIKEGYGNHIRIFKNIIPSTVKLSETSLQGKSINKLDSTSKAAISYSGLTKEIINVFEKSRNEHIR